MHRSHDYDKILTRLTIILHRLYDGESLGVSELAEEFNVSSKTIQRDFNERLIRFPIEKVGRKWRMREGYRLEKIQNIDDLLTLQILETLAENIGPTFAGRSRSLLGKLKNGPLPPIRSRLPIEDITTHTHLFRTIEEAIFQARILHFTYHGKRRDVHPYRIVNFDGYWYLMAFEKDSGLVKKFYLKEVESPRISDERFDKNPSLDRRIAGALNAWFDPNVEPFELHLLAKSPIVKYLKRRPVSPSQSIVASHSNGDVEIVLKITTEREALEFLKSWIPDLVVLSPRSVRELYQKTLRTALDLQNGHDAVSRKD